MSPVRHEPEPPSALQRIYIKKKKETLRRYKLQGCSFVALVMPKFPWTKSKERKNSSPHLLAETPGSSNASLVSHSSGTTTLLQKLSSTLKKNPKKEKFDNATQQQQQQQHHHHHHHHHLAGPESATSLTVTVPVPPASTSHESTSAISAHQPVPSYHQSPSTPSLSNPAAKLPLPAPVAHGSTSSSSTNWKKDVIKYGKATLKVLGQLVGAPSVDSFVEELEVSLRVLSPVTWHAYIVSLTLSRI